MDMLRGVPLAHKAKILLVDDDPAVRRSLQLLLRARGFDVRAYASGTTLLADTSATDAACLVVDYRMSECDGFETLLRLRKQGWQGPAILITGFPSAGVTNTARRAGFDVVLEKPLRHHALVNAIERLARSNGGD